MKKKVLNTEKIIGLSAIFISLLTLFIFLYQTSVISKQARLSVTPRISFNSGVISKDSTVVFSISIKNNGLGPAIIDSSAIIYKKNRYPLDFKGFIEKKYPLTRNLVVSTSSRVFTKGTTLLSNNEEILTEAVVPIQNVPSFYKMYGLKEGDTNFPFDVIIFYSSIYEEKWKVSLNTQGHPIKL